MQNNDHLIAYKTMPLWDYNSLPKGFKRQHNTKAGTWAKLAVYSGKIQFDFLTADGKSIETLIFTKESEIPFIEPQQWHKVTPLTEDLSCQLTFYCEPKNYFQKKYQLSATHSEVLNACQFINSGTALDLGCGRGRNSLYLQSQGFNVCAIDNSAEHINTLNTIIQTEKLNNITANQLDLRSFLATNTNSYNLIICTVVLMFIESEHYSEIISNIQQATKINGINVIVSAIDDPVIHTDEVPFSSAFNAGELQQYYSEEQWQLIKYDESPGQLHRRNSEGNFITLPFATLIAKKLENT